MPATAGGAVSAVGPLRHGLGNAATDGIWRVPGTAGSAVLKVARLPSAAGPPGAFPTSDVLGWPRAGAAVAVLALARST